MTHDDLIRAKSKGARRAMAAARLRAGGMTFRAIGASFGCSLERARQLAFKGERLFALSNDRRDECRLVAEDEARALIAWASATKCFDPYPPVADLPARPQLSVSHWGMFDPPEAARR